MSALRDRLEKKYGTFPNVHAIACSPREIAGFKKDDSPYLEYLAHEVEEKINMNGKPYLSATVYMRRK